MTRYRVIAIALGAYVASVPAQQGDGTEVSSTVHLKPAKVPAIPERVAALACPAGFPSASSRQDSGMHACQPWRPMEPST